jgi:hypothetical protein
VGMVQARRGGGCLTTKDTQYTKKSRAARM